MEKLVQPFPCIREKNNFYFLMKVLNLCLQNRLLKKLSIGLILFSYSCFSQQEINSISKTDSIEKARLVEKISVLQGKLDSINKKEAQEKEKIIKDWSVEGRTTFLFNQTSFSNWTAGGENNVAGTIGMNYDFNYKNEKWKWDNKIIASYGATYIKSQGYRKTDDRFEYNSILALNTVEDWYFSFFSNFISQFSRGFDYSQNPKVEVSSVFSPAYLSFGPGILWRKSEDIRVNIAPATSRFIFVSKPFSGMYGVPEGKRSIFGIGLNISAFLKFKLMDDVTMENIIALYSDYLDNPQNIDINHQANFRVAINKYLSMNLTIHLISDSNASKRIQFRQLFGLGVNYTFHKI